MSRRIAEWRPNDEAFWEQTGKRIAKRNLVFSIFAEFLGFSVWQLWSVVSVKLGDAGFDFSTSQLFWLISIPGLVGATLRFPYTFAPARYGGRNWTIVSALLLIIPCVLLAYMVSTPGTPYWAFVVAAATAGFGGGNFASSMANISYFYPDSKKGFALGLNAAGGNIGVAVVQKVVPLVIGAAAIGLVGTSALANASLVWLPLIVASAYFAWRYMDNLDCARSTLRDQAAAVKKKHTWVITWLYVGAFGSFIGYSAALPLLIKTQFTGVNPLTYAFLGPLVGSISRPFGGWISDRLGGARVTLTVFALMSVTAPWLVFSIHHKAFGVFLAVFLTLFVLSGMANGSVYRMVPTIFRIEALREGAEKGEAEADSLVAARRLAAAAIGISSAVAAYGGFVIPQAYRASLAGTGAIDTAFYCFIVFYGTCMAATWWYYVRRRSFGTKFVPTPVAEAGVA